MEIERYRSPAYHLAFITEGPGWESRVLAERLVAEMLTEACRRKNLKVVVHLRPGRDTADRTVCEWLQELEAGAWEALRG